MALGTVARVVGAAIETVTGMLGTGADTGASAVGENSRIEWCDHTFNPFIGCTKISPGCDNCYAESWAKRSGLVTWGEERRRSSAANWKKPLKWNAEAAQAGTHRRVFCASLADVFDNEVPDEWRADLFRLIRFTPNLDWLLLTKRIGNATAMIEHALTQGHLRTSREPFWPWPNVWIGATVVNQEEADRDIPKLLSVPAAVRFLSCEPLLGPIDLSRPGPWDTWIEPCSYYCDHDADGGGHRPERSRVDWVIVGGESGGSKARPINPAWVRSLRDQCVAARVPFLFKQWGQFVPADAPEARRFAVTDDNQVHEWDQTEFGYCIRVRSKHDAGRTLDGRTWDEFPKAAA